MRKRGLNNFHDQGHAVQSHQLHEVLSQQLCERIGNGLQDSGEVDGWGHVCNAFDQQLVETWRISATFLAAF